MTIHRVVGRVLAAVRLVVTDHQALDGAEAGDHPPGAGLVLVPQHADVPGPRAAGQHGRERVHRGEQRRDSARPETRQHGLDGLVVGIEQVREAREARGLGERLVAGDRPAVAFLAKGFGVARPAIAVHDQARVARQHGRCVERVRQAPGQFARPDVPGDVLPARQLRQSQAFQAPRKGTARVVANDQHGRFAVLVQDREGRRIVPADQGKRRVRDLWGGQGVEARTSVGAGIVTRGP